MIKGDTNEPKGMIKSSRKGKEKKRKTQKKEKTKKIIRLVGAWTQEEPAGKKNKNNKI